MPSRYHTNVFAFAKQSLAAGTKLDGIGGHHCYGLIENVPREGHSGLPICLAEDVTLVRDIAADQPIALTEIDVPEDRIDFRLYAEGMRYSAA